MNKLRILIFFITLILIMPARAAELMNDNLVDETLSGKYIEKPLTNVNYNYESTDSVPIKLKITQNISTKKGGIYDAMPLTFIVKQDVRYNRKVIVKQGSTVKAKVSTYMERGMNGIPALIIVDDFEIEGIDSNKLHGTYLKKGFNNTPLVLPIKWALTPIPGVGSLTNFIFGGHAKITSKDTITLYYYPDRGKFQNL